MLGNYTRSGTEFSVSDSWELDENTIPKETDKMMKMNGVYLLSGRLGDKLKKTAHLLSREEKFLALIILQEEECSLARLEGTSEPSSSSSFVTALETTKFVRQHQFRSQDANRPIKVTLDSCSRSKSFDSILDYVIHGTEMFYEEKVMAEINLVYRHCNKEEHLKLDLEDISYGDIAVAFDEATGNHRVKLLAGLDKKELGIRCKLLDDFGKMRAFEDSLFKLLSHYKFPPMLKQIRLEHLWHYDSLVLQKMYIEAMLFSIPGGNDDIDSPCGEQSEVKLDEEEEDEWNTKVEVKDEVVMKLEVKREENLKVDKEEVNVTRDFHIVLNGKMDPDGLPLCFLIEENAILTESYEDETEQKTKPECTNDVAPQGNSNPSPRNINDAIMKKLLRDYKIHKLFRRLGESRDVNVSHVKSSGSVFLQNRRHPMYRHLDYLLNAFHSKKDTLKAVTRKKVKRNEIYLVVNDDKQVFRVQIPPFLGRQRLSKKNDFIFVQFYDGGDPLTCVDTLYLASEVDPYLSLLPPQCSEVKLFNISTIPHENLSLVKSMFPVDTLFRAVTVEEEEFEDKGKIFTVEIFKIPPEKLDESQKQPQLAQGTEEPYFEGKYVSYTPLEDFTCKRHSITAEILKFIPNRNEKEPRTRITPMTRILKMKWENPMWAVGKIVTAFVDTVFDFNDFILISRKDLKARNTMDDRLNSYMKPRASAVMTDPPGDRIPWNYVTRKYIEDFPGAIFIAPIGEGRFGRAIAVNSNPAKPTEVSLEGNKVKVLFLDYGIFKEIPVGELRITSVVQYLTMSPLSVWARTSEKVWRNKTKKGFQDFKTLTEQLVRVKIMELSLDRHNRTKVRVKMLDPPKNIELSSPPTL